MASSAAVAAAGILLRRATGRGDRFLLLRSRKNREWGFPKGHQDPGEELLDTARRECEEETGIRDITLTGEPIELLYHLPDGRLKRVVYFPAVTAVAAIRLSDEHDDGAWCSVGQVRELISHAGLVRLFEHHLPPAAGRPAAGTPPC